MNFKRFVIASAFTIFSISINCFGSFIAGKLSFPLYLDSLMTIFLVFRFGLGYGIFCAVFTNLCLSSFSLVSFPFAICHVSTALLAYLIKIKIDKKGTATLNHFLFAGLFSAISNTILGNLITAFFYKEMFFGIREIFSSNLLIQAFYFSTENFFFSVMISGLITNLVDKIAAALISYFFFRITEKLTAFFQKTL